MSQRFLSFRMLVVTLAAAALGVAVGMPSAAYADTPLRMKNAATGQCLGAYYSVFMTSCSPDSAAVDVYWHWHSGTYGKVIRQTSCLDSNTQRQVYGHVCNGGSFQEWRVRWYSNGYEVKNVATGYCLDANSAGELYTHVCNGGPYQRWRRV